MVDRAEPDYVYQGAEKRQMAGHSSSGNAMK